MESLSYRKLGKPIDRQHLGLRIDFYLGQYFRFRSRTQWKSYLGLGEVLVNTRPVKASYRLSTWDQIEFLCPTELEPEVDRNIRILWQEDGVMAVFKPANLPMHEGGRYHNNTFAKLILDAYGPQWSAVHRLDRETSGLVLCGDETELRNQLSAELRTRKMQKTYYAIGVGEAPQEKWTVDAPIGAAASTAFRYKQGVVEGGLPSQTDFEVIDKAPGYVLLKVSPKTGRTHQIRVHAAYSGLPLLGDKKYHPEEWVYLEALENGFNDKVKAACLVDRLCLHAGGMRFTHPKSKESRDIRCPMPEDFLKIWQWLKVR